MRSERAKNRTIITIRKSISDATNRSTRSNINEYIFLKNAEQTNRLIKSN